MKLNKTCCSLANFVSYFIVHSLGMGLFLFIDRPTLVCGWVNFPIVWPHTPVQTKLKGPPGKKHRSIFFSNEKKRFNEKDQVINLFLNVKGVKYQKRIQYPLLVLFVFF